MSELEERVREIYARWNAGEREFDEDLFDPSLTVHSSLTGAVYEGSEGLRTWIREIEDQFREWKLDIDEVTRVGEDQLIARGTVRFTGRKSEVVMEQPGSWLFEFSGGRLKSLRNFIGRDAADDFAKGGQ